ncbi:hypothetical protein B0H19DRAFT_1075576 [Mycena capillaripes]|nr:hypothetical protein B0H19DRAFT_1075576 [Mycena capillaripes]
MNNHWHLKFGKVFPVSTALISCGQADQETLVLLRRIGYFGLNLAGDSVADFAADDATVPMPIPTPSDDATVPGPTLIRRPTFDSLVQERLAHRAIPLPPDNATVSIATPTRTPTFDSLIQERLVADYTRMPFPTPMPTPYIHSPTPRHPAVDLESAHPCSNFSAPTATAPPISPPALRHALAPLSHAPPTGRVRSLLRRRRKPKPRLSSAVSFVMEAAVVPWMYAPATSMSTSPQPASNSSQP